MKKRLLLLLAAIMISSCGKPIPAPPTTVPSPTEPPPTQKAEPTETPLPTVTPACISPEPTQNDIDFALAFSGQVFDSTDWERTYTVSGDRVSVTWLNNPLGAVAYLEVLIFPCGYEEPDLNNYYDDNWGTIFQNYESYTSVAECRRNDGLRLYEFEAQNQGFEYGIKYWVKSDTDSRVISLMVVFPLDLKDMLDNYSARLFPIYSSCP
jgi:hypothetical protein